MKAEYNKWYKCEEGTMPEDFGTTYMALVVRFNDKDKSLGLTQRVKWLKNYKWVKSGLILTWMLPEPYAK